MYAYDELKELCAKIGCPALVREPMSAHTTFQVGGEADLMLKPKDEQTAALLLQKAAELHIPIEIVGKGSNLLVSDTGVRAAVLSLEEHGAQPRLLDGGRIACPAGASLSALCVFAWRQGLTGLEFAYGIPGSVGGAVYMNAGAYGGEMKDVLCAVRYLSPNGEPRELPAQELALSYRHSWFSDHPGYLITEAVFALSPDDPAQIKEKMDVLMQRRCDKQPLEYPSAGSTFKRPEGNYASALIDQCGLKGLRVGGAMVSEKHAGFVVNYEDASCADVLALIARVQQMVQEQTGYLLECEVKRLGE